MKSIDTPLSIVITTYNRPEILKRCLNSIRSQEYNNYEIIVVDDHSLPTYQKDILINFPEVNYIYQKVNTGPGAARNKGIEIARNNFIVIMDDDDVFMPNAFDKINKFISIYQDKKYPVYNFLISNATVRFDEYYRVYSFSEIIDNAIKGDLVHIINKECFSQENYYSFPNSRIGSESLLWYRITIDYGFPIINEVIVELMEDSGERLTNVSRQVRHADEFSEYQINIISQYKSDILAVNNTKFLVKKYLGAMTYLLLAGNKIKALRLWIEILRLSKKHIIIFPILILPKKVLIKLFYQYRKI